MPAPILGPAAADRAGGRAWQLDPRAARRFAVSPSAAIKLMQRVRPTGSAAPAPYARAAPRSRPAPAGRSDPDLTLAELQTAL
jgi:hypothetical protein